MTLQVVVVRVPCDIDERHAHRCGLVGVRHYK